MNLAIEKYFFSWKIYVHYLIIAALSILLCQNIYYHLFTAQFHNSQKQILLSETNVIQGMIQSHWDQDDNALDFLNYYLTQKGLYAACYDIHGNIQWSEGERKSFAFLSKVMQRFLTNPKLIEREDNYYDSHTNNTHVELSFIRTLEPYLTPYHMISIHKIMPTSAIYPGGYLLTVLFLSIGIFIATLVMAFITSMSTNRPIHIIHRACQQYSKGNLDVRIPIYSKDVFGFLAQTLEQMARDLKALIHESERKQNELLMVIENMREGLIALDMAHNILLLNTAAKEILDIHRSQAAEGRMFQEVVRNIELNRLIDDVTNQENDVLIERNIFQAERRIKFYARSIVDEKGEPFGIVIIFMDVTRQHQLEKMRKNFVANVSHELKTPLTSMIGMIETMQDGVEPDIQEKFLKRLGQNAKRLHNIIEDILFLSRLESGEVTFEAELVRLRSLVDQVLHQTEKPAEAKNIVITTNNVDPELYLEGNPRLLEHAVLNLLDNAIKYSPEGSRISVECGINKQGTIYLSISDQGMGIPEKHLERIFERFYRVDKGRSRDLGGTGLGLSIVKHIMNFHKAKIEVVSKLNEGSTFTLTFPNSLTTTT